MRLSTIPECRNPRRARMQYTSLPLFLLYALLSLLPALPAVPLIAHNAAYSRLPYFPGSEARHGLTDHDNNGDGRQRGELTSSHGSDIVLRCDFSTDFEADALLNASKYLEADVWGSRKNWIDIRLPSSRVSASYCLVWTITNNVDCRNHSFTQPYHKLLRSDVRP